MAWAPPHGLKRWGERAIYSKKEASGYEAERENERTGPYRRRHSAAPHIKDFFKQNISVEKKERKVPYLCLPSPNAERRRRQWKRKRLSQKQRGREGGIKEEA